MTSKPLTRLLAGLMIAAFVSSDLMLASSASAQQGYGQQPYGQLGQGGLTPGGVITPVYPPSPFPTFGDFQIPRGLSIPPQMLQQLQQPPASPSPPPAARSMGKCQANGGYTLTAFPLRHRPLDQPPPPPAPAMVTQVSVAAPGLPDQQSAAPAQAPLPSPVPAPGSNQQQLLQQQLQQQQQQQQPQLQLQLPAPPINAADFEDLSRMEAAFNSDMLLLLGGLSTTPGPQTPQPLTPPPSVTAPLRQYGYDMFGATVTTFAPIDDMPVGPDYVVGPGDDLTISVWGPVDSTIVRTVDRSGRIVLPKVGDLRIWGLTFSEADRLIREQLARYFRGFQTSVTMGRLRTVRVHVVGEVCQPGVYMLSSLSTLTNALFSAGGPTKLGSLRNIRLLRNHHVVGTIDLYDFLQRGDRTRDFRLESGDTVFVPPIGDVATVVGEVKRPAIYEVQGDVRLADIVGMAAGVTPSSYLKRVQIVRAQPNAERVTLDVDMSRYYLTGDDAGNPPIQGGDMVLIHKSDRRIYNTVKVDGAVKYPGVFELRPAMRIADLLPADKLLPEAFPDAVEISRRRPDFTLEILTINLNKAWAGDPEQNVSLKPLDEIAVRTEFRTARTVTLTGQIVRPGLYTIAEGERLSSVLARAGGFTEKAFLDGTIFTRAALRRTETEQLKAFVQMQEKAIMAAASTTIVGAEREEVLSQQQSIQSRRELLKSLATRVAVGRMVVHLAAPERLKHTSDDIVLLDGDALEVPEPPSSVLVLGSVRTSTSVLYRPDADIEYYVNRVGGYSKEADKKEVHIVKADGSAMGSFTKVRAIEPGDTIIVPPKEEEKIRWLPTVRDVLQSVGSALISFAALAVLF